MTVLWLLLAAAGLAVAANSSARGVDHAAKAAAGLGVPAFLIGFTLVAVGTDLPEVANSIASSLTGHGDVNVGDSIGSSLAQGTLVIGLVPFLAKPLALARQNVAMLGALAVAALLLAAVVLRDGHLSRVDGAVLIAAWAGAITIAWRHARRPPQPELPLPERQPSHHAAIAAAHLVVVGVSATVAVLSLTNLAQALGMPEFILSFLGLALGTSLPELTVAVTATRQGRGDLALGNVLGATLADASLSLGSGPLIAPTAITADLAVRGALLAAAAVGLASLILVAAGRHNRLTGAAIVLLYITSVPLLASAA